MIKLVICAVTIVTSSVIGIYASLRLQRRVRMLEKLILLSRELSVQIRYQALPIPVLLYNMSQREDFAELDFLYKTVEETGENGDFHICWEKYAAEIPFLKTCDKEIILSVGRNLGNSDIDGQTAMFEMTVNMLTEYLAEANEEYTRKGKMCRSVGALVGIGIAVVVF